MSAADDPDTRPDIIDIAVEVRLLLGALAKSYPEQARSFRNADEVLRLLMCELRDERERNNLPTTESDQTPLPGPIPAPVRKTIH